MASGQESGLVTLRLTNANESTNAPTPFEKHTTIISGGAKASPTGATFDAIPFNGVYGNGSGLYHSKRAVVLFTADATDIIESEESQAEFPVLLVDEQTGAVRGRTTLTFESMTGFTAGGTVDITATAGILTRVAHQDAPQGLHFAIDPQGKMRVYMGDDA